MSSSIRSCRPTTTTMTVAVVAAATTMTLVAISASAYYYYYYYSTRRRQPRQDTSSYPSAYESLVGNTPLIQLHVLSQLIGHDVYVKMESLNPGGTGKDRAALGMIIAAEQGGELPKSPAILQQQSTTAATRTKQTTQQQINNHNKSSNSQFHDEKETTLLTNTTATPSSRRSNGATATNHNNASPVEPAAVAADTTDTKVTDTTITTSSHVTIIPPGTKITDELLDATIFRAMLQSRTGGLVVEGTSGSTGIALANLCRARGHACLVVLPDDQAIEKQTILASLGAVVLVVPTASIAHASHYVNVARRIAARANNNYNYSKSKNTQAQTQTQPPTAIRAAFMNQFENLANVTTHYQETGPEIWHALLSARKAPPDVFVMSAGTGGTVSGVGRYFKEQAAKLNKSSSSSSSSCRIVVVDPPGSVLFHKINHGIAYTSQQAERQLKRHRYDTVAEGIGLDRITANVAAGLPYFDTALRVSDQEALDMAHWLLAHEGLWVGSSSAMNVVGAVRTAMDLEKESSSHNNYQNNSSRRRHRRFVVVTVICDAGQRHVTRFWNRDFCESWGLQWPQQQRNHRIPECLQPFYHGATTASNEN